MSVVQHDKEDYKISLIRTFGIPDWTNEWIDWIDWLEWINWLNELSTDWFLKIYCWCMQNSEFTSVKCEVVHISMFYVQWMFFRVWKSFMVLDKIVYLIKVIILNLFWPMFPFYTPWKRQKTFGFLVFSRGMKWKHWLEMA